jgi:hypothetical protein
MEVTSAIGRRGFTGVEGGEDVMGFSRRVWAIRAKAYHPRK